MASIYKRPGADFYTMNFSYRGVRINRSTGQRGREAAERKVYLLKKRIDRELGERVVVPKAIEEDPLTLLTMAEESESEAEMTFEQAIKKAYLERFRDNVEGATYFRRLTYLSQLLRGDQLPLVDISKNHIKEVKNHLTKLGKAPATVNRYLAHFRTVLYLAKDEWEIIDRVPKFKLYKEKEGRIFFYTQQQEKELLAWYLKQGLRREADLVAVLFDTGMRMGEALKITYERHISLIKPEKIILTADICKSGKPRTIPLTCRASLILKKIKVEGFTSGPFSNLGYSYLQKKQKKARLDLKLPSEACFHACRHTCATRLLENGVDIRTVQQWLGHSSITTTERYLKTTGKRLEKAAASLNCVVNEE
jgi:integrase